MSVVQQVLNIVLHIAVILTITYLPCAAQTTSKSNLQYSKGIHQLKQGDKSKAIASFKKTIQKDTTHFGACLMLVKLYLNLQQVEKAKPYLARLQQLDCTPENCLEKEYYLAYIDLLAQNYKDANRKAESIITAASQLEQPDFYLISKCYNMLGYLDAMEYPVETKKNSVVVSVRALQNAKTMLQEALKFNPEAQIAAKNYNIVTTALKIQPFKIEPYPKDYFSIETATKKIFTTPSEEKNTLMPDNLKDLAKEWNTFDEVVLMLDASGSMRTLLSNTSTSRFEQGQQLSDKLINYFNLKVKVGLVLVAGECGVVPKFYYPTLENRSDLTKALEKFKADGHTPINDALTLVPKLLQLKSPAKHKAVIFITDGIDSCDPQLTCELTASLGAVGVAVHIINLESSISDEEYDNYLCMTASSGGTLRYISTENQLEMYKQIQMEDYLVLPKLEKVESTAVASL